MPPVGFEHTISAGERPQTYTLDRATTGTGDYISGATYIWWSSHHVALRYALAVISVFFLRPRAKYLS